MAKLKTEQEIRDEIKRLDKDIELHMPNELPRGVSTFNLPMSLVNIIRMETMFWVLNEKMPNTRKYNEGKWEDDKEKLS